jgi:excisionase family DNA binding protein
MTSPDESSREPISLIPNPEQRPTLTVPEAGKLLGLSRPSAYEAAARGEIPTLRIGRRLLVPTASLLRMLGIGESGPELARPGGESRPPLVRAR